MELHGPVHAYTNMLTKLIARKNNVTADYLSRKEFNKEMLATFEDIVNLTFCPIIDHFTSCANRKLNCYVS